MNLFDLQILDPSFFSLFSDLQVMANKKRQIDEIADLEPEGRTRLLS